MLKLTLEAKQSPTLHRLAVEPPAPLCSCRFIKACKAARSYDSTAQYSLVCAVAKSSLVEYSTCVEEYSTLNPKPCSIVPCRSGFDQEGGLHPQDPGRPRSFTRGFRRVLGFGAGFRDWLASSHDF